MVRLIYSVKKQLLTIMLAGTGRTAAAFSTTAVQDSTRVVASSLEACKQLFYYVLRF